MNATSSALPISPSRWEHTILRVPGLRPAAPPQASPRVFSPIRALWLAAECCALKALLVDQQTKITGLEERQREAATQHSRNAAKIAALIARNRELTTALYRTACAG